MSLIRSNTVSTTPIGENFLKSHFGGGVREKKKKKKKKTNKKRHRSIPEPAYLLTPGEPHLKKGGDHRKIFLRGEATRSEEGKVPSCRGSSYGQARLGVEKVGGS